MKIKTINSISFEISTDIVTVVTDPLAHEDFGLKFPKTEADVAIFSQKRLLTKENLLKGFDKLVPQTKEKVFEINGSGEYEISQVLIQRPINAPFYIIDSGLSRVVYIGLDSKELNIETFSDLGDVEVLLVPVGNGNTFVDYEKLQDIIAEVEPAILVPYGYKTEDMKNGEGLKTKEEFLHHFGYSNSREEKTLKVPERLDNQEAAMEIVFLS